MVEPELTLRHGGPDDLARLLGLFDEAVAWMVARGQPEQWGATPWSEDPARRARVEGLVSGGGLWIARLDGEDVGALVLGERPSYVPAIDEPELYVLLLLSSRTHAHEGIGARLVARAVQEGHERGVDVLRVDCWAGAPTLVAWYVAQGFARSATFEVNQGWVGQVFEMTLS